jgi:TatD DNase family protein
MLIDTHAHIFLEEFKDDLDEILNEAQTAGISEIFMPNIDSTTIDAMMDVDKRYNFCHPMIGLHPCHVGTNYVEELKMVEKWLSEHSFTGIGEIGIDLYWDKTYISEQEKAFMYQLNLSKEAGLPVVIHSRDSLDLTIQMVSSLQDGRLSGIFHCFGGNLVQAQQIIDLGFYMGIGGILTYKNAGLDKIIPELPLSSLVLETDSPYLSPVPNRGKRNVPSNLVHIATKLAELKNIDFIELAEATSQNAKKIFNTHQFAV